MAKVNLIPCDEICMHYRIEQSFIKELQEHDLMSFYLEEKTFYLPADRLSELERLIRLHYELEINLEGLEAITHLLQRMESMQNELQHLQDQLNVYKK